MSEEEIGVNDGNSQVCGLGSEVFWVPCSEIQKRESSILGVKLLSSLSYCLS